MRTRRPVRRIVIDRFDRNEQVEWSLWSVLAACGPPALSLSGRKLSYPAATKSSRNDRSTKFCPVCTALGIYSKAEACDSVPALPVELWHHVFSFFDARKDRSLLANLCQVSRTILAAARPVLYRVIESKDLEQDIRLYDVIIKDRGSISLGNFVREATIVHRFSSLVRESEEDEIDLVSVQKVLEEWPSLFRETLHLLKRCPNISRASFEFADCDDQLMLDNAWFTPLPLRSQLLALPFLCTLRSLKLTLDMDDMEDVRYVVEGFATLLAAAANLRTLEVVGVSKLHRLLHSLIEIQGRAALDRLTTELVPQRRGNMTFFRDGLFASLEALPEISTLDLRLTDGNWNLHDEVPTNARPIQTVTALAIDLHIFDTRYVLEFLSPLFPALTHLQLRLGESARFIMELERIACPFPKVTRLAIDIHMSQQSDSCSDNMDRLSSFFRRDLFPALQTCRVQLRLDTNIGDSVTTLLEYVQDCCDILLRGVHGFIAISEGEGIVEVSERLAEGDWQRLDQKAIKQHGKDLDQFSIGPGYREVHGLVNDT